jgi:(1->4)-alpha-D-glucan 1-alpha-D-glucosylmutase
MVKAAREAKRRTGWTDPSEQYERSLRAFIRLVTRPSGPFGSEMERLVRRIGPAAATNSLALAVLKSVCPGVPDIYQGTELWDFSLTDPDNRRPVDFAARRALLADLRPGIAAPDESSSADEGGTAAAALLKSWPDGRIKLHVLRALLHLRRAEPTVFDRGSYHLVETSGALGEHAMGIVRRHGRRWVVALVPRLTLGRAGPGRFPTGPGVWGSTRARLPVHAPRRLTDVLTGVTIEARGGALDVGRVFGTLPVAVLYGVANGDSS